MGLIPSHHKVAGKSLGSFLFFVSLYLCFLASALTARKEFFVIPLLVLSFSDVAAAVVGRSPGKYPLPQMKWPGPAGKTVAGSTAFFISTLVILFVSLHYLGSPLVRSLLMAFAISLPTTASEALSPRGIDNFSIPLTILLFMQLGLFV
jgi:dolichol kinase